MAKKVIITTAQTPFVSGGAELMIQSLKKNLISRGFEAEVVMLPFKGYPEETIYNELLAWRLLDLEESDGRKIDLVIATKYPSFGARHHNKVTWLMHQFRQAYDLYDAPYGFSTHPNGDRIRKQIMQYDSTTLKESKKIYTISQNVANRLKTYNNIDSAPLYHPPSLIGQYKTGEYGDYIVSVGRLNKMKRNELLIEALAHCDKRIRAKIAGKGPEMKPLQELARKLGVSDRVDFLGFVDDKELLELYAGSFAVFFAPLDEDYGYITLEAFHSHKPVITCRDSGGVLEFAVDGENSFISDTDPEALGRNIDRLYNNKELCRSMGASGFNSVKGITWDNVIDTLTQTIR